MIAFALAGALAARAEGVEPDPVTRALLTQQLKQERGCQLDRFISWRAFGLAGHAILEGRIACVDGRQFDVTRSAQHRRFEIRLCLPAYC
jgi:hypothetical protein